MPHSLDGHFLARQLLVFKFQLRITGFNMELHLIREHDFLMPAHYRDALDAVPDIILLTDAENRIIFGNRAAVDLFELSQQKLREMRMTDLVPPSSLSFATAAFQAIEITKIFDGLFAVCTASGKVVQMHWRATVESTRGLLIWSGRQTDYWKQSYDALSNQLKEKEILLKETHHRIKNNLQVVSSLINLQAHMKGATALDVLQESQNRIRTMALIHEHLYESEDALVDLSRYVYDLANNLCSSYSSRKDWVKVIVKRKDPVFIHLDRAVPCGLIANEIISNSLKYAFAPEAPAEIRLSIFKTGEKTVMELSDNGKGLPSEVSLDTSKTLGLRLVKMLVAQISGKLTIRRNGGTHYLIEFGS